ncbi:TPA: tyrosine-type recombinase/integrase [Pseudomonas aeruginosa]|nr:tyrosine-type recombinase/integrase [Pseudomonas aeruginosa]HCF4101858.1 tyrosine-type recombinase/integrase [Pseudomonas aeruginosa]
MASFRKRGDLQWQARINRKGFPAQVKTFSTRAEAEAWARQVESEIDRGVFVSRVEAEATSLSEAFERYEREISALKKGAVQERSVIVIWKATDLARRSLAAVRSADVARLRDEWLKTHKSATVLRRLAVLSHVFTIARKEWGMEGLLNPVELIRKPQVSNARTRRIVNIASPAARGSERCSEGEVERILAATGSDILPAIVRLAIETAMRRGEIVSLRWEHIDLKRRVAHLPSTKNGNSRDVPLSSKAVSALASAQGAGSGVAGRVFDVREDTVTQAFDRALKRARSIYLKECEEAAEEPDARYLTDLRFHDLRHEATSRLADIFPLHELTKITGHKDTRMLMRYYHPRAEDLAKKLA